MQIAIGTRHCKMSVTTDSRGLLLSTPPHHITANIHSLRQLRTAHLQHNAITAEQITLPLVLAIRKWYWLQCSSERRHACRVVHVSAAGNSHGWLNRDTYIRTYVRLCTCVYMAQVGSGKPCLGCLHAQKKANNREVPEGYSKYRLL